MSRLIYKGDTINNFGKFLPTPIIEKIKINSVNPEDDIINAIDSASDTPIEPRFVNKYTITTSALFNSDDVFDSTELINELFSGDDDSTLYLNLFFCKNSQIIDEIKNNKLNLSNLRDLVTIPNIANESFTDTLLYKEQGESASFTEYLSGLLNNSVQIYSIPFSNFANTDSIANDFDDNGKPIIRAAFTEQSFHILNVDEISDLTIFASISSEKFENLCQSNLSRTSFAINFSDISYEDVKVNGVISKFSDPIFVDSTGLPYTGTPLQTIDGRFFKSDTLTHEDIKKSIQNIVNNYKTISNKSLENQIQNIEYVLARYGATHELIPRLYKANRLSPSKSYATDTGQMYSSLSIQINKLDKSILAQEQVAKRIFRNYKVSDLRVGETITFGGSFDENVQDEDIVYKTVLHSNAARYVPIASDSNFPGRAELPMNSQEFLDSNNSRIQNKILQIKSIIHSTKPNQANLTEVFEAIDNPDIDVRAILENYSGDNQIFNELISVQNFLDNEIDLWAIPSGKTPDGKPATDGILYFDEGRLGSEEEAVSLKRASKEKCQAVDVGTQNFLATMYWLYHEDNQYELVFLRKNPLVPESPTRIDYFNYNVIPVMNIRMPIATESYKTRTIHMLGTKETDSTDMDEVKIMKLSRDNSKAKNWSATAVLEAFLNHIAPPDSIRSQSDRIMSEALNAIYNTIENTINNFINNIRSNPALVRQLASSQTKSTIAINLYNEFKTSYATILENELSNKFDAYIRTPYFAYADVQANGVSFEETGLTGETFEYNAYYDDGVSGPGSGVVITGGGELSYSEKKLVSKDLQYRKRVKEWSEDSFGNQTSPPASIAYSDLPGLSFRSQHKNIYKIEFGSSLAKIILGRLSNESTNIVNAITDILELIYELEGARLNTGLHDALANIDIIIKKSGVFFVDVEKFVRKKSFMSRYINMDNFLEYYPDAHEITNNSINIFEVEYKNITYDTTMKLQIGNAGSYDYEPSNPKELKFTTIPSGIGGFGGGRPLAYEDAPVLPGSFSFSTFVESAQNLDTEAIEQLTDMAAGENTKREYSKLVQRNYSFYGWQNGQLKSGKTWKDDYRLAMFTYQFFIDDDQFNRTTEIDTVVERSPQYGNSSRDVANISVDIKDNSLQTLLGLIDSFSSTYSVFVNQYLNVAKEQCAFNEYTERFNDFFISDIKAKYPNSDPWIRMVSIYSVYLSIFTSFFSNLEYADVLEFTEKILNNIKPETGTLGELIKFDEELQGIQSQLDLLKTNALEDYSTYSSRQKLTTQVDLELSVFDHIGNYSEVENFMSS